MTEPDSADNERAADPSAAVVSNARILRVARELRAVSWSLEIGLYALLAASVLAAASAFAWADLPLLGGALALAALLLVRAWLMLSLRGLVGRRRCAFHSSGLWLVVDEERLSRMPGWSCDLARPVVPLRAPFFAGIGIVLIGLLQLLLLPPTVVAKLTRIQSETLAVDPSSWLPLTISVEHTRAGLMFFSWALLLYVVAGAVLDSWAARARFQRFLAGLGVLLALIALAQMSTGTALIYGLFPAPGNGGARTVFGPFPNRNHFATFMLMVVPASLDLLLRAFRRYRRRVGASATLRRWLVGLQAREGTRVLYALVTAVTTLAALIASASRGGALGFVGGLLAGATALSARRRRWALLGSVLLVGLVAIILGSGPLLTRFTRLPDEASGRTLVWRDTLSRMDGLWLTGAGLNTFPRAMSRATLWTLPRGATPWREPYETSVAQAPRLGYRALAELPGVAWYGHAHNDYLQMLVEGGVPGLLLVLVAVASMLHGARYNAWRLAALTGVVLQSFVDFPLHIPPVAALFAMVAACGGDGWRSTGAETRNEITDPSA